MGHDLTRARSLSILVISSCAGDTAAYAPLLEICVPNRMGTGSFRRHRGLVGQTVLLIGNERGRPGTCPP